VELLTGQQFEKDLIEEGEDGRIGANSRS